MSAIIQFIDVKSGEIINIYGISFYYSYFRPRVM